MYTNVMVEHMVRQRQREIDQIVKETQLIKLARAGRVAEEQPGGIRQWLKQLVTFNLNRNQPVMGEECV